jgi:hypothetical protein
LADWMLRACRRDGRGGAFELDAQFEIPRDAGARRRYRSAAAARGRMMQAWWWTQTTPAKPTKL